MPDRTASYTPCIAERTYFRIPRHGAIAMVANPLTSARRWIDRVVFGRSALDRLSAWELEKKSDRIGRKRDEHKERMENVKKATNSRS
jgi:hypothetical protein